MKWKTINAPSPNNALVFTLVGQNFDEFGKRARDFCEYHQIPDQNLCEWKPVKGPIAKGIMRNNLLTEIQSRKDIDLIALFCHGFPDRLQFGLHLQHTDDLALACSASCTNDLRVVVYACSAADNNVRDLKGDGPATDGGWCDSLRDSLCRQGITQCQVDGHLTAGHTTRNPFLVRFLGNGRSEGGIGGEMIVPRDHALWKKWGQSLKGGMQFAFPMMTTKQILDHLEEQ